METVYLSLIIPAFNEEKRLPLTLIRIKSYLETVEYTYEVLVIDDGSTDLTFNRTKELCSAWPYLKVFTLGHNCGKGAAVKKGMLLAKGEVRAFSDADLSVPIEDLPVLLAPLPDKAQVVIASRAKDGTVIQIPQPKNRILMGKIYNWMIQLVALPSVKDTQCGFKAYTKEAALASFSNLKTKGFGFDIEALYRAKKGHFTIEEVPVHWNHVEGSKVSGIKDSLKTFYDLLKLRFIT